MYKCIDNKILILNAARKNVYCNNTSKAKTKL